ncbi:hypothetical protein XSR1_90012 [Xenorhabdus szentirmaii DSM 16338]|uniref:Uncharacterized protein n=1 Tax=Xenorhabdus szentirmaii DSM 16338 TaxID=1427518 RepID=W1J724_9GAMM|nr:hypothetical protein XSR1_90012 [Xenorhabdus szentirmaii DSM 16338]
MNKLANVQKGECKKDAHFFNVNVTLWNNIGRYGFILICLIKLLIKNIL